MHKGSIFLNQTDIDYLFQILDISQNSIKENNIVKSKQKFNKLKLKNIKLGEIAKQVEALNERFVKENGKRKLNKFNNIVRFGDRKKIPIMFYKNGIKIGKFPFMSYKERKCGEIVLDLIDGYYPKMLE